MRHLELVEDGLGGGQARLRPVVCQAVDIAAASLEARPVQVKERKVVNVRDKK